MTLDEFVNNNLMGKHLESIGDVEGAINLYEKNVAFEFDGSHPYTRLCIIYRKRKQYDEEIRVANAAVKNLCQNSKKPYFRE
ncbi:tetratricopeptide (TPR) repeat protein [Aequitasia blattaphilus]|uniref:Tetratricopeptide repeat protein n=1 Tax=Aequitasia blattaphilus TaxID=2949332 RepID=A0ABT1ECJ9_9FIRM|nr:hypothetical protein [Aequitasia blattaphilus]MCP1103559.1 hypothetical protein [Aequitasia blattaphilus]MCR8616199.1 hypothetical protein [Aequitasia blattaphilus]